MSVCRNNYRELTAEEVSHLVSFINPDCDYIEWRNVLMAIHDWSSGDNVGYRICQTWSAKSSQYTSNELLSKWRSFKRGGGITIATLRDLAKRKYGYTYSASNTNYTYVPIKEKSVTEIAEELARERREKELSDQQFNKFLEIYFATSRPAPSNHPYLAKKNVLPHSLREMDITATPNVMSGNNVLVVPMSTIIMLNDSYFPTTQSFQFIYPGENKIKPNYKGRTVTGCFYIFAGTTIEIYLCEGWATGATIHEQTGATVIACFSCTNMSNVAENIKKIYSTESYPNTEFVVAADNDKSGLICGSKAAKLIDARLVYPVFPPNIPGFPGKDFNDLHNYLINTNKDKHYE